MATDATPLSTEAEQVFMAAMRLADDERARVVDKLLDSGLCMSTDAESVYRSALQLPEDIRVDLAGRLLQSVDPAADPDWESTWRTELSRRAAELDSGEATPIPLSEALRLIEEARNGTTRG